MKRVIFGLLVTAFYIFKIIQAAVTPDGDIITTAAYWFIFWLFLGIIPFIFGLRALRRKRA